jgi:hypothetical protein
MDAEVIAESRPLNKFAINALKSLIANVETGTVVRSGSMVVNGGICGRGFVCRSEDEPEIKMIVTWGFADSSWRETPCNPPNHQTTQLEDMDRSLSVSSDELT